MSGQKAMAEPTIRSPNPKPNPHHQAATPEPTVDAVENLVTRGGYEGDPREIVENPAVTPEMLNEPGDQRIDLLEED